MLIVVEITFYESHNTLEIITHFEARTTGCIKLVREVALCIIIWIKIIVKNKEFNREI